MICSEVGEFISALCDGETVPPAAAEHIGGCAMCCARLHEYLALGAEMRRVASLEPVEDIPARSWAKNRRTIPDWWTKGWETMRIPRFAFALLLVAIVALGSSLVVVRARAHGEGTVLLLTARNPNGSELRCALSLVEKNLGFCAQMGPGNLLGIEVLSHTPDQVELGIRTQYKPLPRRAGTYTATLDDLRQVPQKSYWFHPGNELDIDVGLGTVAFTGELTDHIPPFFTLGTNVPMDPNAGELRVISPILLSGRKVAFDFEGVTSTQKDKRVVQMYMPGNGLWVLSLHPLEGAVEAEVNANRVKFKMDGDPYTFVMAAPVTREQHIWVLHDPNYKPSDPHEQNGFLGAADPGHLADSGKMD